LVFREYDSDWLVLYAAYPAAIRRWTVALPVIMTWNVFEDYLRDTMRLSPPPTPRPDKDAGQRVMDALG